MTRIRTATAAVLLASIIGLSPAPAWAKEHGRRDRYEDRRDRHDDKRDRRERQAVRDAYRQGYWDAAQHYRHDDRRYKPRRLDRQDVIYRGSDNRYYCKRDDGTTGLIIGGVSGGVLGHIIAPGGSKTLGTIIGAGAGALIGRQVDKGDIVCRESASPSEGGSVTEPPFTSGDTTVRHARRDSSRILDRFSHHVRASRDSAGAIRGRSRGDARTPGDHARRPELPAPLPRRDALWPVPRGARATGARRRPAARPGAGDVALRVRRRARRRPRHHQAPATERLALLGGHIGYVVVPAFRGRGYGTRLLRFALDVARDTLGLDRVLLTCDDDNVASIRVIERNGGVLENVVSGPEPGVLARRYWIETRPDVRS